MYYGDDIVVSKRGLRINPKALRPIGIADKSICWGIQVPPAPGRENKKPNLVISAFPPENWHILFRVIIELRDKKGTLAKVTELLSDVLKFNILSTQCAPAGHNHASMHTIGAALNMKEKIDAKLRNIVKCFNPEAGAFDDDNKIFRKRLGEEISLELFEYSRLIEDKIEKKNKSEIKINGGFLHPKYIESEALLYTESLLETYELKNQGKSDNVERFNNEIIIPVKSRWLQHMAVFRIYSEAKQNQKKNQSVKQTLLATWDAPISFEYNRAESLLKPRADHEAKYLEIIDDIPTPDGFPVMAIAAFTSNEHYVRIVFPDERKRIFIDVNYTVKIKKASRSGKKQDFKDTSSIGLLKEISKNLDKNKINLNYVENSVTNYTPEKETGKIHLVGTPEEVRIGTPKEVAKKFEEIRATIKSELDKIADERNATFETNTGMVGAKRIFISTKFKYLDKRPNLKKSLLDEILNHGFTCVMGDPQDSNDPSDKSEDQELEQVIRDRIISCHAFLQIKPKTEPKAGSNDKEAAEWLLFELGVARGAKVPYAICVDHSEIDEYPKVGKGWAKIGFDSGGDETEIIEIIHGILIKLAGRAYDRK